MMINIYHQQNLILLMHINKLLMIVMMVILSFYIILVSNWLFIVLSFDIVVVIRCRHRGVNSIRFAWLISIRFDSMSFVHYNTTLYRLQRQARPYRILSSTKPKQARRTNIIQTSYPYSLSLSLSYLSTTVLCCYTK